MYGTIARLKAKPGAIGELRKLAETIAPPPGAVVEYLYQMDHDPDELWMVVMFESKEAYHANARRAETHAQYEQMLEWLTEEPQWHDGEVIFTMHFGTESAKE